MNRLLRIVPKYVLHLPRVRPFPVSFSRSFTLQRSATRAVLNTKMVPTCPMSYLRGPPSCSLAASFSTSSSSSGTPSHKVGDKTESDVEEESSGQELENPNDSVYSDNDDDEDVFELKDDEDYQIEVVGPGKRWYESGMQEMDGVSGADQDSIIINEVGGKKWSREDMEIYEDDIEERFVRGSGKGGQSVNKTNNCVVLKHIPTGTVVKCHLHRSLEANRKSARRILKERIDELVLGRESRRQLRADKIRKKKARRKRRSAKKYNKSASSESTPEASSPNDTDVKPSL